MNRIRQQAEGLQGAVGVVLVAAGVALVAGIGWALVVLGLALVLGALFDTFLGER